MLTIVIPKLEIWNELTNEFLYQDQTILYLEHSLISISKWEARWNKPFLSDGNKSKDEILDYIKCMDLSENTDSKTYNGLSSDNIKQINDYISLPMTATWFSEKEKYANGNDVVTSEIIYYWMIALNIPFECQYWHLNRLLTLIKVCNIKNQPPKKMSSEEILRRNSKLNEERKRKMNTKE